ncbi:anti-sigma factor family protein [Sphaerisporangium fuscum]|uniref:anti-sigma factor family protein n=1 Tax=Sphaerisporangium fuscum TaxID=2835868 RepID=UPI001BDBB414|nr:zf-HC2 domain-containing protein [Sphaerisporangium fuscum]
MTGLMDSPPHVEVAAYVLGILSEEDAEEFDRHLLDCPSCQKELVEMYELPDALNLIKSDLKRSVNGAARGPADGAEYGVNGRAVTSADGAVPDGVVRDLWSPRSHRKTSSSPGRRRATPSEPAFEVPHDVDEVALARDRRRRNVFLAVAAAVIIGVTGTVAAQLWPGAGSGQNVAVQVFDGRNGKTGVNGSVGLVEKEWGTEVSFKLAGVTGPERCSLVAVGRDGGTDIVSGWRVPDGKGYGVAGHPGPLTMTGGTALARKDIVRFEVRRDDGERLLQIPVA